MKCFTFVLLLTSFFPLLMLITKRISTVAINEIAVLGFILKKSAPIIPKNTTTIGLLVFHRPSSYIVPNRKIYKEQIQNAQLSEYGIAIYGVIPNNAIPTKNVKKAYFRLICFLTVK